MNKYDIVIIGGGTAGCAAAYTAGILGFRTLLIEKNIHLGGSITSGLVVPAMNTGENKINTEFFDVLSDELSAIGGQVTYQGNKGWYNPELTKVVLDKLMDKASVDVLLNTSISNVLVDNNRIKELSTHNEILSTYNYQIQNINKLLSEPIETRYVIDATGNCEVANICGCEFLDESNSQQPQSLRFIMGGVNINLFSKWLLNIDTDRNVTTVEHIDGSIHLSTAYTWDNNKKWALKPLFEKAVKDKVLEDSDRNYFQIFTIPGMNDSIAFNCPRIPNIVNLEDTYELSKAIIEARKTIYRLSNFCRLYFPGFKNAYISNIADSLGIRVSRRIKGKYVYTIDDLRKGKKFKNPVLISNYPIDIHSANKDKSTLESNGEYQLPVESLISKDINNLFVAGRCISADFMSQSALRVQPNCFSMGEGIVKYIKTLES